MSTPRFTDEHLVPLRRVMLARQPTFVFSPEDLDALIQETGLLKSQIQDWAKHFRCRSLSKKLDDALANLRGNQLVSKSLGNVTCQNLDLPSTPNPGPFPDFFLDFSGWTCESQEIFCVLLRRDSRFRYDLRVSET
jgi:hypothetical protein